MGKRIKVGIVFNYDEQWIGGTYYFQYLIQSLNLLVDEQKPEINIISRHTSSFDSIENLKYPYIKYHLIEERGLLGKIIDKFKYRFNKYAITGSKKINFEIDIIFHPTEVRIPNTIKNHLYWIPDFQEIHLPHLFSKEYLSYRKFTQNAVIKPGNHILFSSNDAMKDFKMLYPDAKTTCYVVPFSVFHQDFSKINFEDLKKKYFIDSQYPYFFSPNQFWKHKNHFVVLNAIKRLKDKGREDVFVIFSGKEGDQRNPTYFQEIKDYIRVNHLEKNIKFLGFIHRREQLCFMDNALAVIQPSLFEGWSSVVEDAKSLNKNIILSSLNVHIEQVGNRGFFFNPESAEGLADHLVTFMDNKINRPQFLYKNSLQEFGKKFMEVVTKIVN